MAGLFVPLAPHTGDVSAGAARSDGRSVCGGVVGGWWWQVKFGDGWVEDEVPMGEVRKPRAVGERVVRMVDGLAFPCEVLAVDDAKGELKVRRRRSHATRILTAQRPPSSTHPRDCNGRGENAFRDGGSDRQWESEPFACHPHVLSVRGLCRPGLSCGVLHSRAVI